MSARSELLVALSEPVGLLGVDLEDVEVSRAGRRQLVRVIIDRDGGVDLDLVSEVSRRVSELLDQEPLASVLDGPFVLEVSSPGVDRPLTQLRHWRRAIGRLVHVDLASGDRVEGRVVSVDEAGVVEVSQADGVARVDPAQVSRATVQVEFNRTSDDEAGE